jgi:hypothetical protein
MRTWSVRTIARHGADYMELDFPTQRPAYNFALDWFLDDPTLLRIELVDGAGRAEPLILDRRSR